MKQLILFCQCVILLFLAGCSRCKAERVFPDVNPYQVDRIVIAQAGYPEYVFSQSAPQTWILETEGSTFLCDNEVIMQFLTQIANVTFSHVRDKNKKVLAESEKCQGTDVSLRQEGKEKRFSVKKAGEDYQSCYILRPEQKECVLCFPYIITMVNQPLQKWLKKSIFDAPYDKVSMISLTIQDMTVGWKRDTKTAKWSPISSDISPAQEKSICEFYHFLQDMKIHDAVVPQQNENISKTPRIVISVVTDNDSIHEFQIRNQKNSTFYYASRTVEETGVLLFSRTWMKKLKQKSSVVLPETIVNRIE
ncbi:MAG: hypothetical protein AB1454_09985 [Candidatus Auribacterota bacterium]